MILYNDLNHIIPDQASNDSLAEVMFMASGIYGITVNTMLLQPLPGRFLLTVLEVRGDAAVVMANGRALEVQSEIPLQLGQTLLVRQEQGADGQIRLRVIRDGWTPGAAGQQAAPGMAGQMDLPAALRLADLPVAAETVNRLTALLKTMGGLSLPNLLAAASFLKTGLTSNQVLQALASFLNSLLPQRRGGPPTAPMFAAFFQAGRQPECGGGHLPAAGPPAAGAASGNAPVGGVPVADAPSTGTPTGGAPSGGVSTTGFPAGSLPVGGALDAGFPAAGSPDVDAPAAGTPAGRVFKQTILSRARQMVELLQALTGGDGGQNLDGVLEEQVMKSGESARQVLGGQVYTRVQADDRSESFTYLPLYNILNDHGLHNCELYIYPPGGEHRAEEEQGPWLFTLTLETATLGWMQFKLTFQNRRVAVQALVEQQGTKLALDENWPLLAAGLDGLNLKLASQRCELGRVESHARTVQGLEARFQQYNPFDISI
jgi:hypothetical protein